jgi:hypothetical protein
VSALVDRDGVRGVGLASSSVSRRTFHIFTQFL